MSDLNNTKTEFLNYVRRTSKAQSISFAPESFVELWQKADSIESVYKKVEQDYRRLTADNTNVATIRPTYWKNSEVGLTALKTRATQYRKKGVLLKSHHDELSSRSTGRIDWKKLSALAEKYEVGNA